MRALTSCVCEEVGSVRGRQLINKEGAWVEVMQDALVGFEI